MDPKAKYIIIVREAKSSNKFYARNFRTAVRHGKFIFKYGTARSVCVVNMSGKVGFYRVDGQPEKSEEKRTVKEMI